MHEMNDLIFLEIMVRLSHNNATSCDMGIVRMQYLAWFHLCRPKQWIKNVFVAAPLFFSHHLWLQPTVLKVLLGVGCFCCVASAIYILNDFKDRVADRMHPKKCQRPIASGAINPMCALLFSFLLLLLGVWFGYHLSTAFACILASYYCLNLAYCFGLKSLSIIDVMCIALGFVLRVEAGAVLIQGAASVWIIICTGA